VKSKHHCEEAPREQYWLHDSKQGKVIVYFLLVGMEHIEVDVLLF